MLAAVVGGNLQGIEAVYLSQKAGVDVRLIDKNRSAPASGLCDQFIQFEVTSENHPGSIFEGVDLVIPALENMDALMALEHWTSVLEIPFAFDPAAYGISSSKSKSNRLFEEQHVPIPRPWPYCGFPVLAKPDTGSGSHGVKVFHEHTALEVYKKTALESIVLQEFVQGPFYSIEVLGAPGQYASLQVTDLHMDQHHDCKRVLAPTDLPDSLVSEFKRTACTLAHALALNGLMDVEAILHENELKVLEIDARLPSQTPTAVYWSTGLNMIQLLGDLFLNGIYNTPTESINKNGVIYEHICVRPHILEVAGERVMSGATSLGIHTDFFGADEAISNYKPDREQWVATLIFRDSDRKSVQKKRDHTITDIMRHLNIETYLDTVPLENGRGQTP
ncbi:MAG: 3-methylornithine--L-lysine ligase PylC [Deltaproteobacteria bacterium]|nr:3-methylornithine--L-lysine ligase PylC [Deltaproteobacteria bacterium]